MTKDALDKGSMAEKLLADFLSNKVFSHYVYLNPKPIPGKELCDVLIILQDKAVILQVKNKDLSNEELYKDKDVKKNVDQCRGASRFILSSSETFALRNEADITDDIDLSKIKKTYCLSVMYEEAAWFGFYDDKKPQRVHIINFESLKRIFEEINTLPELFLYLDHKETFFDSDVSIMLSGGEEELYALWIDGERSFSKYEKSNRMFAEEGIFEQLVNSKPYKIKKSEEKKYTGYWDELIRTTQQLGSNYKAISDELVDEDSLSRRMLGAAYGEYIGHAIQSKIPTGRFTHYSATPADSPEKLYIFLFYGVASEDKYRDIRQRIMQLQAEIFVRKYYSKHTSLKKIIGVGTDSVFSEASGFDFMLLPITDEFIQKCSENDQLDEASAKLNILQVKPRIGSANEYTKGFKMSDTEYGSTTPL